MTHLAPGTTIERRRVSLQVRFVVALLVISLVPLAVSAMLIPQIAEGAQRVATNQAIRLRAVLVEVQSAYRDLIEAKKQLYAETARRVASSSAAKDAVSAEVPSAAGLTPLLDEIPDLLQVGLIDPQGVTAAVTRRNQPRGPDDRYRDRPVRESIPGTDWKLELVFGADLKLLDDNEALAAALEFSSQLDEVRTELGGGYLIAFLVLVGGVVVIVIVFGILSARRITRRIALLVTGTRHIAMGDLQARVKLDGRDELAELAAAFNGMVQDLEDDRRKIIYLQRIGAWQDVARKLAHEIKNPLTPIQLAVQQAVSAYDGDDERFEALLAETEEIVGEEIANLRRLVDAFSALGRLPRVEARSLDLGDVVDDLTKDPVFLDHLEVAAPAEPVMVRADRLLLRRVVANLVENGIQASGGGKVVVTWRAAPETGRAVLTVDDEGPGVPPDSRETIFEPYVTSKETGTGLGLAIAKKIAIEHHGSLDVSPTKAPTGGARFVLAVPLADGE